MSSSGFAANLRIANWNMANLPNTAGDVTTLQTIYSHMGSLNTGAGRPFDVMAMVETDTQSTIDATSAANSLFPASHFLASTSTSDGGGDRTGFLFDSNTVSLIGAQELTSSLTHNVLRGHFRPIDSLGAADFYCYAIHLKSGTTTADRAARVSEAQALRADADALGSAAIVFAGDFNWTGADELGAAPIVSAWDVFAAAGAGQASDPVNAVGNWRNNAAYLSLHTNDPGASMDDRFDMQLLTAELSDHLGLDYVTGSYKVVGNNGTHVLGSPITTGTGAPTNVLSALASFSDHLPVIADYTYSTISPEPTALGGLIAVALVRRRRN